MKKFILTFTGLMASVIMIGQNKDSLLTQMARETCTEIKSKDFSKVSNEDLELELGMAMMPLFAKYSEELKNIFNVDLTDQEAVTTFGQEIGMKLLTECPEFIKLFANRKSPGSNSLVVTESSITGKLQKISDGEFTHIIIKDRRGKAEKLYWFEYFEGADMLLDKKRLDKELTVKFVEKEVYNASLKDYMKIRVITGIIK